MDINHELQTNLLIRLQMSDQNMVKTLTLNPDPKLAETLIEKKLKTIGLNEKEIAILFLKDGLKYPLEKALAETGLSQTQLDSYYDSASMKVTNFLEGKTGIIGNLKSKFAEDTADNTGVSLGRIANTEKAPPWNTGNAPAVVKQGL